MYDPQSTSSGSIMPRYPWLMVGPSSKLDKSKTEDKMRTLVTLGVPYTDEDIANEKNLYADPSFAEAYEADKKEGGNDFVEMKDREIVALIAYLQRLGTDIKVKDVETVSSTQN